MLMFQKGGVVSPTLVSYIVFNSVLYDPLQKKDLDGALYDALKEGVRS